MRILLATDGSDAARIPEALLAKSPLWSNARVDVVSVATAPIMATGIGFPGEPIFAQQAEDAWKAALATAHEISQASMWRLREAKIDAHAEVLEGDPATVLLDFIKAHPYDLVAVGSHGEGAIAGFFLGSVARRLISYSPVTVLVGRCLHKEPMDEVQRVGALTKLSVLVAADGSRGAEATMLQVKAHGASAFAKAVALTVEPLSALPADLDPSAFAELYRYDHEQAVQISTAAAEGLKCCADVTVAKTLLGRPSEKIVEAAKSEGTDLVALGATRHGVIERFLLGSVSYEVATTSPCSVLVVRVNGSS